MLKKKIFTFFYVSLIIIILTGCGGGGGGSTQTIATGSISMAWVAPTTYVDGTPITNLGGFKAYYGTASRTYTHVVDMGNVTSYTINSLPPGTYYLAITSYDLSDSESDYSSELSTTIP